jgi:hypothetical protein
MYEIATTYDAVRRADCRTADLLPELSERQTDAWWDYLINYTIALAGCPLVAGPLPDGVLAFGPANTQSIGVQHPSLGRDDVALLIDMYLSPFAATFALSMEERNLAASHLSTTAARDIAPEVSSGLSRCATDAGPPTP